VLFRHNRDPRLIRRLDDLLAIEKEAFPGIDG
jgi:hypothetical protein